MLLPAVQSTWAAAERTTLSDLQTDSKASGRASGQAGKKEKEAFKNLDNFINKFKEKYPNLKIDYEKSKKSETTKKSSKKVIKKKK